MKKAIGVAVRLLLNQQTTTEKVMRNGTVETGKTNPKVEPRAVKAGPEAIDIKRGKSSKRKKKAA